MNFKKLSPLCLAFGLVACGAGKGPLSQVDYQSKPIDSNVTVKAANQNVVAGTWKSDCVKDDTTNASVITTFRFGPGTYAQKDTTTYSDEKCTQKSANVQAIGVHAVGDVIASKTDGTREFDIQLNVTGKGKTRTEYGIVKRSGDELHVSKTVTNQAYRPIDFDGEQVFKLVK